MKVCQLQNSFGIENLTLVDQPEPQPQAHQVVLKMRACSLNYRDLLVTKGQYNPRIPLPFVPLSDGVGEVVAVGDGVKRVKVGERVAGIFMQDWLEGPLTDTKPKSSLGGGGTGMLAEHVVLHEEGVVPVPAHLSDEEAACLPCAAVTAWNALAVSGGLRAGETVLTLGTGGVSLFAVQFAKIHGANIVSTSSSDDKLARVRELGASELINYKSTPKWGDEVRKQIGGADHVVEVGGAGTLPQSLRAVRTGGHIALIGVLSGASEVNPMALLMKGVRMQGIYVGSREMFEAMNRAIALHQLRPVVDKVFTMEEIQNALRHMESGYHFGKICVRITN